METFFTKDKNFYKVFFRLMLVVALQNLVAYSVLCVIRDLFLTEIK